MDKQSAVDLLKQNAQRTTNRRVALLELLMSSPKAFALSEIEKQLSISIDRVTIYRTLYSYVAKGLVIKMVDHKGTCLYMFNHKDHCDISPHPHLRCKECKKVICLPSLPHEYLERLEKYEIDEMYFLMEGTCSECATAKTKTV
ncbi:transcriptional repressor [Fulvivirgaceae bacterium BMA12]|uniref:Transcriptional repressor n=1 Tax=Agaribacillus aureus TaxID=3051825 RepID=A0ABT8L643_9BACT|nr:transcriptional repressor [Fulvivirgaceae bacterium BMA12]